MKQLILALLLIFWAGASFAAVATPSASPIKISADKFVIDEAGKHATFTGNVNIARGPMQLWADNVVVDYGAGGISDIENFVATGSVRIKTKDQSATGNKAVFVPETQILTISGNVKVDNAMGTVNGPELVINLETNSSVFSGGSGGRVTGVFTPQ